MGFNLPDNFDLPALFKSALTANDLKQHIYTSAQNPDTGQAFREAFDHFASDHALLFNDSTLFKEIRDEVRHIDMIEKTEMIDDAAGMSIGVSTFIQKMRRIGERLLYGSTTNVEEMIINKHYDALEERLKGQGTDDQRRRNFGLLLDYADAGLIDADTLIAFVKNFDGHESLNNLLGVLTEKAEKSEEIKKILIGVEGRGVDPSPIGKFAKDISLLEAFDRLDLKDLQALKIAGFKIPQMDTKVAAMVSERDAKNAAIKIDRLNNQQCHLRELGLSNEELLNFFKNYGTQIHYFNASGLDAHLALELVKHAPNLNQTVLSGCRIDDSLAQDFAAVLKNNQSLTFLNMSKNTIGPAGAQALSQLATLRMLNLESNRLGPEGAQALSSLVHLENLNITSNQLGPLGAQALYPLVNLQILNAKHNGLGLADAIAFRVHLPNTTVICS